jgi:serine/threonine protein kinase
VKSYYIAQPSYNETTGFVNFANAPGLTLYSIFREIETLATCNHSNVIKIFEVYLDSDFCHIVTELCTGYDMFSVLKREHRFTERKTLQIFA